MAEINQNVKDDSADVDVKEALRVITDNFSVRNEQDSKIDAIQGLFEEAFLVTDPKGTRKLSSQRLYQALWRTASRMKPLDFIIHGTGKDMTTEKVVTAGVATVMDKGGYDSALRDKNGAFFDLLLFGDGLFQVGANDDKDSKIPIIFSSMVGKDTYTDNFATGIRMSGRGRSTTKLVTVFSYSWDSFVKLYPDMEKKAGVGRIQRNITNFVDQQRTFNQEANLDEFIEVAHSYDLTTDTYVVFCGSGNTIIEKHKGEDYPFIKDGSCYIPVSQFVCIPSSKGFWNNGIGNLLFKLAIISRQLMNMEVNHIQDNTYPIELISVAQGDATKFFNRLKLAHEMRAKGQKGYLPMERSANDPTNNSVSAQSLVTQNLFNEWQAVFDRLDQEIRRLGINIDELDVGATKTATEVLALEENANSFVKQIMEWNASETQFLVELTMDMITEFVPNSDKTPLNLTTKFKLGEKQATGRIDGVTLGEVSEELKKGNYFVQVNARTGAIPSNVLLQSKLRNTLALAQPGSKASVEITELLARNNDIDIPGADFFAQPGGAPQEPGNEIATGTDRLTINARAKEQVPVI